MDNTENKNVQVDLRDADARLVSEEAALALYRKKGLDIRLFHVEDTTVITEYYVICTGRASTHLAALADEVKYRLELAGVPSYRTEGRDGREWLLVDFGAVIVHIFSREAREYYNLERLLKPESEIDLTAFFDEMKNKIGDTEG